MIQNNDMQSLSKVSDDLSFLVDQEKLNLAFERVSMFEDRVRKSCLALKESIEEFFRNPQLQWKPALAPS
jgi:hypothetical protein